MAKLILQDVVSGFASIEALNANFAAIEAALDNTLSLDGSLPNSMSAEIDAGGNKVINVSAGSNPNDAVNYGQLQAVVLNYVIQRIEDFTATAGQDVFTLTAFTYQPDQNNMAVYVDGVRLFAPDEFEETSTTVVTLVTPLAGGEKVTLVVNSSLGTYGDVPDHSHTTADITNLSSYTGLDTRYFTEAEVTAALALKAALAGATFTGAVAFTSTVSRKDANTAATTAQPRIFVQAADPGAKAADGDLWAW